MGIGVRGDVAPAHQAWPRPGKANVGQPSLAIQDMDYGLIDPRHVQVDQAHLVAKFVH